MTIPALDWAAYETYPYAGSTAYMYGLDSMIDGPCAVDYDPWVHAEQLQVPIVTRNDLPTARIVACFSRRHRAIFIRGGLAQAVERCAVAHELVHYERNDIGTTRSQEDRADRIAARRLIRPMRLEEVAEVTEDPARMALELEVTERIMRVYMRTT